jgi:hypothetical protein
MEVCSACDPAITSYCRNQSRDQGNRSSQGGEEGGVGDQGG